MDKKLIQKINAEALIYLGFGWRVMPLVWREKTPLLKSWPNLRIRDLEFVWPYADNCNIGVILGRHEGEQKELIDFDLDCEEAQLIGPALFPDTAQFGHSGKVTHLLFYGSENISPLKLHSSGIELELRAGALQTMLPPSIHPNGKQLIWVGLNRKPKSYTSIQIYRNFKLLAALSLIARRWPKISGSRNDFALAVSGVLARSKLLHEQRKDIIYLIALAARDEEAMHRPSIEKAIRN